MNHRNVVVIDLVLLREFSDMGTKKDRHVIFGMNAYCAYMTLLEAAAACWMYTADRQDSLFPSSPLCAAPPPPPPPHCVTHIGPQHPADHCNYVSQDHHLGSAITPTPPFPPIVLLCCSPGLLSVRLSPLAINLFSSFWRSKLPARKSKTEQFWTFVNCSKPDIFILCAALPSTPSSPPLSSLWPQVFGLPISLKSLRRTLWRHDSIVKLDRCCPTD